MSILILEDGIQQFIRAQPALITLIGSMADGFFLNSVPEKAHDPCIGIQVISDQPDATNNGPTGLNFRRYQFCCYAKSYVVACRVSETLRLALDGFTGTFPNGQRVYNVLRDNSLDGFDDLTNTHRKITDYIFHFAESLSP